MAVADRAHREHRLLERDFLDHNLTDIVRSTTASPPALAVVSSASSSPCALHWVNQVRCTGQRVQNDAAGSRWPVRCTCTRVPDRGRIPYLRLLGRADSTRTLEHGQVTSPPAHTPGLNYRSQVHSHVQLHGSAGLFRKLPRHDGRRLMPAQQVDVDSTQQADAVAVTGDPLVVGCNNVFVGMLGVDTQGDHIVHDRKDLPQECQRNGLPAPLIRSITRLYCGTTTWRIKAGDDKRAGLEAQVVAKTADGKGVAIALQEDGPDLDHQVADFLVDVAQTARDRRP